MFISLRLKFLNFGVKNISILENLQLQERQLIAINETLKYQIAREAGHDSRLSVTKPESAVFISPAKIEAKNQQNTSENDRKNLGVKA